MRTNLLAIFAGLMLVGIEAWAASTRARVGSGLLPRSLPSPSKSG